MLLVAVLAAIMTSSCAHVISADNVRASVKGVGLSQLAKDPVPYTNDIFIFGGTIAGLTDTKEGSEIEIVQNPVDRYGFITDRDISEGRFIVIAPTHLDPLIYQVRRLITVAGKLTGVREKKSGATLLVYPVFEAKELYLWKEERLYPPYPFPYGPYYDRFYFNDYYMFRPYW